MIYLLLFLAFLGLARILELAVSARNWQTHQSTAEMPREALFPWMVALHSSVFVLLPLEYWLLGGGFGSPLSWLATSMVALALLLRFWTLATIGRSWNVRVVGGPNYPIVDSGPYAFIRHPNYVVVALELCWIPLMWGLWRSALLLTLCNGLILRIRIRNEEAVLQQNPQWRERMAHKPRFIPRFK